MARGRKKIPNPKTVYIKMRISRKEKQELLERLAMQGLTITEYLQALIELDKREGYICRY